MTLEEDSAHAKGKNISAHLEICISSNSSAVPQARQEASRFCQQAGFDEDDCADLDLALGEALANAVVHAQKRYAAQNAAEDRGSVSVSVWDYRSYLIVQVRDEGHGFTPPSPPYEMPAPESHSTHGRGFPLMELLTDALMVCRGDVQEGGASIFLIKGRTQPCTA